MLQMQFSCVHDADWNLMSSQDRSVVSTKLLFELFNQIVSNSH